jgi:hypothetical protein
MVLLVNSLALLWMLSTQVVPAEGGRGAGDTAVGNGDVNCDGRIDLSDPVYMLSYLFQNGPELCAIAQEPSECCGELLEIRTAVEELLRRAAPRPRDIRNLDGSTSILAGAESITVFEIPATQWFVVTEGEWARQLGGLYEFAGEVVTEKVSNWRADSEAPHGFRTVTGVAFQPGSSVGFVSPNPNENRSGQFFLSGYLVDAE